MQASARPYALVVLLAAFLVALAILGTRGGLRSSSASLPPDLFGPGLGRIAYVDLDGHVLSMNPDGSSPRPISEGDGFFTWPTWSPDARRLVFSGVEGDRGSAPAINLYSFDIASGETDAVFVGEPGVAGLLAEGVVHYPLWSPDSRRLAFIAVTGRGLTLFVDEIGDSEAADLVLDQGPLWMSWSSSSEYLLVHRGADHFIVDAARGNAVERLASQATQYRVPAWVPGRETVTIVSSNGANLSLANADVIDGGLGATRPIAAVAEEPAFLWSPDGTYLALSETVRVVSYLGLNLFAYRDLTLIPSNEQSERIEIHDNVLAYFWSPDSSTLAYVTLSDSAGVLRWRLLSLADRRDIPLVDFVPSPDQLTMLQFFDQYAYSHSLWSPDSRSIVFAGHLATGAVTASATVHPGHAGSHIIVVEAEPNPSVEVIAPGVLGFWSPR